MQISKILTYLSDKMHLKKVIHEKEWLYYTGGSLCADENLYP
jgi:hypothetical protein